MIINNYDHIIVYFSGGKDSIACFLWLLETDVDISKVELWHHDVDGNARRFMDWPCTEAYCKAFAHAFDVPLYLSWKHGGFLREMMRKDQPTAPITFETPYGSVTVGGESKKLGTRHKFPQVSADLSVRWCSAYLKIDVAATAIRNQSRFVGKKTLVISGERAEESPARAKYKNFEPDRSDNREGAKVDRHVDRLRPIHAWTEAEVWAIHERFKINAHPAYHLGFGRLSCMDCIFAGENQLASIQVIDQDRLLEKAILEDEFQTTIHRSEGILERAARGTPYPMAPEMIQAAKSESYNLPIILERWIQPTGAYGESCGPN